MRHLQSTGILDEFQLKIQSLYLTYYVIYSEDGLEN